MSHRLFLVPGKEKGKAIILLNRSEKDGSYCTGFFFLSLNMLGTFYDGNVLQVTVEIKRSTLFSVIKTGLELVCLVQMFTFKGHLCVRCGIPARL